MKTTSPHSYNTELERRILHGLALEWQAALWVLPPRQATRMKPPVFSLKEGEKTLAHWNREKREMAFSRSFVLNYPWDSVREVLVHEMAHQYTHEILNITDETAHGPGFLKACQTLGANPKASGTYQPLTDRIVHDDDSDDRDRLMIRIKKLLSLGQSSNRNEAEAAVAKAHHLIRKYNVAMLRQESDRNFVSVFVGKPSLRRFREDYLLARLLTDHYFVYGIWVSTFVLEKGKMGRVFEITGTIENVKIAAYVFDFISRHMHREWDVFNKGKNLNRARKTDFISGLIQGFSSTLTRSAGDTGDAKKRQTETTPMVLEDQALIDYTAYKYPRIVRFSRRGSVCDTDVLDEGKKAGKKLILIKGVEKKHHGAVLTLPEYSS
jgi:hypothetical protein